ncbi:hypothetical protein PTSG_11812 [Salpingoeca rosetta]|uniref:TIR domain-containing protein n=1 Tax=Salpingoeca rosetta (strain ATCC 50818 / BSB-021) TaxID=946362 RepID=F2TZG2_SALR5|nr:uncharacterized protein PTSG_11812 [Salpingoeca rosetta]EGD78986.1 hypothetical protein PTSG_11812 [Salpingoeca rosetta]|eukprot:XP_004997942.1 hypothetical protein PTSG_11812 [Salpingoeca rosetta]
MSEFDVFLTHDWGVDGEGRNNHDRVAMVNTMLKAYGFNTWFDEERMSGHIVQQMCKGIDGSQVVLVFVTKRYISKVNAEHDDNCKKEFNYAVMRRTTTRMIPIVMEDAALDTRKWEGPLGMELGSHLYVRMTSDRHMRDNLEELVEKLDKLGVKPKTGSAPTPAQHEAAKVVPRETSFVDHDGDAIAFQVTPSGLSKFVNKQFRKAVTRFDYRPIDGDLRDQDGWGGKIAAKDRSRVINDLRLMCAEHGVRFRSYEAVAYVDNDGDRVMFCNSPDGLRKYVNGQFRKIVKSLRYRKSDHDLRDHEGWGGRLPAKDASVIIDQLAKTCRNIGVRFTTV